MDVLELLIAWGGARVGKRRKRVCLMIPLSLMWIIWRERNMRFFEGVANPLFRIKGFCSVACIVGTRGNVIPPLTYS